VTNPAHVEFFQAMLISGTEVAPLVVGSAPPPDASARVPGAAAAMRPDGSAVWTIPLTVAVNIGGQTTAAASVIAPAPVPVAPTAAAPPAAPAQPADGAGDGRSPNEILKAAKAALSDRSNVLGVRLGFVFEDGRITTERAIVVTVREKKSIAALDAEQIEELPATFGGLRVQVSDPTIAELIKAEEGFAASESLGLDFDPLAAEITYVPPANPGLQSVKAKMKVIAHVSPDAGWRELSAFLAGTGKTLVAGMYDFGAQHIVEAIAKAGKKSGFKSFTLTLQPGQSVGEGTKADDLTDKESVERLEDALGKKFDVAWVKIGIVNGWVASSYHIKVATRDKRSFWLSSGNWQSSNQPAADPLEKPWNRSWLTKYNREWHAIVDHPGLTADFEKYLLHDFKNNQNVGPEALILPDLLVPEEAFLATFEEKQKKFEYFEPFEENRVFEVQPLLTPDNFLDHVLPLIKSAKEELLIQNQTFNAPRENQDNLTRLMEAVLDRQKANVRVRIIFRILNKADARKNLEALQEFGFDMADVKVQKNCHTKGVVVDRRKVLLGSQNWSEQGVSLNRDASLLFNDAKLAEYFAKIFEHDWANLATDSIDIAPSITELASSATTLKEGSVKLSVEEYLEML
jgi:hypothetical protein